MKHIWSILCQKSSIDVETNLLSLFECVEELSLVINQDKVSKTNKQIVPLQFQIVSFWTIEDTKEDDILEVKISLLDPDKKLLSNFENKFNIKKGILRFRNRINIKGLPITQEGRYIFKISQRTKDEKEYKETAELPLDIKITYKLSNINKL